MTAADPFEWGDAGSWAALPEDVRHAGTDAGAHHRYVTCGCGCEAPDDGPPLRNLRGLDKIAAIEFRALRQDAE